VTAPTVERDVERTGELVAVWRHAHAEVEQAPTKTAIDSTILADLPRAQDDDQVVVLPGFVRYRIGRPHPVDPFSVYLHRLDASSP
jgi:hypothetical protein